VSSFATRFLRSKSRCPAKLNSKGMVLASSLTIVSVLLTLGIGIRVMLQNDYRILANLRSSTHSFYYSVAGIEWSKNEIAEIATFPPTPSNQTKSFANGAFALTFSSPVVTVPLTARITVRSVGTAANATHVSEAQLIKTYDLSDAALALRGNPARALLSGAGILISGADHNQINGNLISEAKPRLAISTSNAPIPDLLSLEDPAMLDSASLAPGLAESDYLPANFVNQLAGDLCSVPTAILHPIPTAGSLNIDSQVWGSQSSPEIHCVEGLSQTGDAVNFTGNISGVGILVVRNADLVISGIFHWQGLIIVNGQEIGLKTTGSTSKEVVGAAMLNETGTPGRSTATVDIQGNFRLLFSREALKKAAELVPPETLATSYTTLPAVVSQGYWRSIVR